MDDLTIEEIKQLVVFYKQRATDLEFQLLQAQLKMGREALVNPETKTAKSK
jgi:hypothetical protein